MKKPSQAPASDRQRLIESLWEGARREADLALAHSRAEADRLVNEARAAADSALAAALEQIRDQTEPTVARILNRGRETSRRRLLAAWQDFLDACFAEALHRLTAAAAGASSLRPLLSEALLDLPPSAKVRIEVAQDDLGEARAAVRDMGIQAEVAASSGIPGGVVVRLDGGREVRDNSLAARLDVLRRNPPLELFQWHRGGQGG